MASAAQYSCHGKLLPPSPSNSNNRRWLPTTKKTVAVKNNSSKRLGEVIYGKRHERVKCGASLEDFIGGDLVKFDLGEWLSDVEEHKALAIYPPHEGGYEGRYLNRLRYKGYQFLDLTARGLGDPETTLTKFHPVCPVSFTLLPPLSISFFVSY